MTVHVELYSSDKLQVVVYGPVMFRTVLHTVEVK